MKNLITWEDWEREVGKATENGENPWKIISELRRQPKKQNFLQKIKKWFKKVFKMII